MSIAQRHSATAGLGILCGLAVAACGSARQDVGGTGTAGGSSGDSPAHYEAMLKFSDCMRSHGATHFPDPGPGGQIALRATAQAAGLNPGSPAFHAARVTCQKLLPGGGPHPLSETEKLQLIATARCLRSHGVTNYPDPKFPAQGGVIEQIGGPGMDPNSPSFQRAEQICGGR